MNFSILFLLILFVSCAPTAEVKVQSAIDEAKYFLNDSRCSKAKDALDEVNFQDDNPDYIMVYASTYACFAGYNEIDAVFGGNLEDFDPGSFFNSLASFSTSTETEADSEAYQYLMLAIDTILSSGTSGAPSTVARTEEFGGRKSGDMSMQVLFMLMVQMGKYFALYGNTNSAGDKGQGTIDDNVCIYSYATEDATDWVTFLGTQANTCGTFGSGEGSDFLKAPVTATVIQRRLCEGIYLYNNFVDVIANLSLPSNESLGDLADAEAALGIVLDAAQAAEEQDTGGGVFPFNDGPAETQDAIATLREYTSIDQCMDEDIGMVEKWHAIFFETIFE